MAMAHNFGSFDCDWDGFGAKSAGKIYTEPHPLITAHALVYAYRLRLHKCISHGCDSESVYCPVKTKIFVFDTRTMSYRRSIISISIYVYVANIISTELPCNPTLLC